MDDVHEVCNANDNAAQAKLKRSFKNAISRLEKANQEGTDKYNETYVKVLKSLMKHFNYHFALSKLGVSYDYGTNKYSYEVKPLDFFKSNADDIVKGHYAKHDAYFRKVNFIFEYFRPKMVNDCFASITLADIDDIIRRCEKVLKDHNLAEKLLPTTGGFFFGSTEYNDWYFYDVKDCLNQMKKFRKLVEKDEEDGFVIFSW